MDNGVEADDGHRYRVNVVEASNVQRIFNVVTKTEKEKFDEEQFQGKDESVRVHKWTLLPWRGAFIQTEK